MTDLKWAPLVGALVITMEKWQELSEAIQPRLLEAARAAGERLLGEGRKLNDEAVETMQRHGLVIHSVPPEVTVYWEQRARAVYPTLLGKVVPAAMVAEVERLRNAYRIAQ
jgi:TRAP-type C4-dicarboxylate transport system substrate-binding protein